MAWGDNDPAVTRPKAAPRATASPAWGDSDVAVTRASGGKKKSSEALGVYKTVLDVADKVNDYSPANLIPGFRERERAGREGLRKEVSRREQTQRPGIIGSTATGLVLTAPLALATRNPYLVGAGQGALLSEHRDLPGIAFDAAAAAALNKAAGVVTDKVVDVLKPAISPAVSVLQKAGVRMTPGQIKGGKYLAREDKAMSRPIVGERITADRAQFVDDFNRGAVNRALLPLGKRLPDNIATGHDAVAFMQEATGKAYDDILPKLSLQPDARLAVGLRKAQQIVQTLSPDQQQTFFNKLRPNIDFQTQGGMMSGRQLTRSVRDLKKAAADFSRSGAQGERDIGAALSEVVDSLDSSLMAQNPTYAPRLKAANAAYRDAQVVNRAAAGADEGIATTGQFKTASRAVDRTKGKRATAAGRGPMQDYTTAGRTVTGKTPNSGTAERLMDGNWIAKARGAVDAGLYEADKALTKLKTAPRSSQAGRVAGLLESIKPGIQVVGGPVIGGLLAGLLPNE